MEFGRKLLSRFGWEEGKGLGKLEDGIVVPLKPKLKFDTTGVGFDYSKEFVNDWWAQRYDEALKKVDVSEETVKEKRKKKPNDTDTNQEKNQKSSKKFIKTETILQDGSSIPENDIDELMEVTEPASLNFDKLFEACGGRTAHKGARHGLGLSGKLARLAAQEKEIKRSPQNTVPDSPTKTHLSPFENFKNSHQERKHLRISKSPANVTTDVEHFCGTVITPGEVENKEGSRKKKKSRKNREKYSTHEDLYCRQGNEIIKVEENIETEDPTQHPENICNLKQEKKRKKKKFKMAENKELNVERIDIPSVHEIDAAEISAVNLESPCEDPKVKKRKIKKFELVSDNDSKEGKKSKKKHKSKLL